MTDGTGTTPRRVLVLGATADVMGFVLRELRDAGFDAWGRTFDEDQAAAVATGDYDAVLFGMAVQGSLRRRYEEAAHGANPQAVLVHRSGPLSRVAQQVAEALTASARGPGTATVGG